uniref:Transcription initiation factor TFIID subunit 9 n=1 Tax=Rhodosorus marinus TaxID=101924 RepID=A0A7S3A6L5_9RHOD|mmetsp:Transcript_529/g.983  ORF Transcript_529/g.983 Transcript_529/m.983 type:complete len:158 (+) Transcript_529:187-660(+)
MSGEERHADSNALGNDVPKDAQVMAAILKAMGVESYEDRVVNQLMELLYRYVCEIIDEARGYCEYAGKKEIGIEDVRLSIQSRISYSFTQPPSRWAHTSPFNVTMKNFALTQYAFSNPPNNGDVGKSYCSWGGKGTQFLCLRWRIRSVYSCPQRSTS